MLSMCSLRRDLLETRWKSDPYSEHVPAEFAFAVTSLVLDSSCKGAGFSHMLRVFGTFDVLQWIGTRSSASSWLICRTAPRRPFDLEAQDQRSFVATW